LVLAFCFPSHESVSLGVEFGGSNWCQCLISLLHFFACFEKKKDWSKWQRNNAVLVKPLFSVFLQGLRRELFLFLQKRARVQADNVGLALCFLVPALAFVSYLRQFERVMTQEVGEQQLLWKSLLLAVGNSCFVRGKANRRLYVWPEALVCLFLLVLHCASWFTSMAQWFGLKSFFFVFSHLPSVSPVSLFLLYLCFSCFSVCFSFFSRFSFLCFLLSLFSPFPVSPFAVSSLCFSLLFLSSPFSCLLAFISFSAQELEDEHPWITGFDSVLYPTFFYTVPEILPALAMVVLASAAPSHKVGQPSFIWEIHTCIPTQRANTRACPQFLLLINPLHIDLGREQSFSHWNL